jgi:hypothetical protein
MVDHLSKLDVVWSKTKTITSKIIGQRRKIMVLHVWSRRLSVTKDDKLKKRGMSCLVVSFIRMKYVEDGDVVLSKIISTD